MFSFRRKSSDFGVECSKYSKDAVFFLIQGTDLGHVFEKYLVAFFAEGGLKE